MHDTHHDTQFWLDSLAVVFLDLPQFQIFIDSVGGEGVPRYAVTGSVHPDLRSERCYPRSLRNNRSDEETLSSRSQMNISRDSGTNLVLAFVKSPKTKL